MTATPEATRARRYLLGNASDEECAVLEQEYLSDDEAVDRIAAAEDELIEDYLANQLTPAERDRFERSYLASPHHKVRVETIRRLMALGLPAQAPAHAPSSKTVPFPRPAARRVSPPTQWLALAAALLLVTAVGLVAYSMWERQHVEIAQNRPAQPSAPSTPAPAAPGKDTTPPVAPRLFAITLPPVTVRSATESRPAVVPPDVQTIVIRLEADSPNRGTLTPTRASIRTVADVEVWQGPVAAEPNGPPTILGRLEVPAARVPSDDYLIKLYGTTPTGAEREWAQYFLRLRKE
jgi:hypothetical protein